MTAPLSARRRSAPPPTPTRIHLAGLACLAGLSCLPAAWAADKEDDAKKAESPAQLETVVVKGLRRSLETSISVKKMSDSIVEAISAEEVGKLPDASIAESLARLPGLTGQRGPDGRVNVISIRGLAPAFAGALLNGREVVSSNDSRAVEYDQFPSELIGAALVYKTPDATLIGQGLSGTVDLRTLKPLDQRERQLVVNLRGERNSNGQLVPDVAGPTGRRFSLSYVDQFDNGRYGIAAGFARLDVSTQMQQTELVHYGDYTPYGLPISGNLPSQQPMPGGAIGQAMLPMFWTATSSSKRNVRDGLMLVLEAKPNEDLHSQLDLYYSKFDTHEVGGKFLSSFFATWGGGVAPALSDLGLTQSGANTLATSGTADRMPVTTGNFDTRREDDIAALGWNTTLKLGQGWQAELDVSASRDRRDEAYHEVYAAPFDNATQAWIYGGFRWNVPVDGGRQTWSPLTPGYLANPGVIKLGDQAGFNFVSDQEQPAYTGAIRTPHIKDDLKGLRLSLNKELDGFFTRFVAGLNLTQRDKLVTKNEHRLLLRQDGAGRYLRDVPAGALGSPFDMGWAGIDGLIRIDVPALVASGAVTTQQAELGRFGADNSGVHEKVLTGFFKLDLDTEWAGIPVRGNVGLQWVRTQQDAEGWEYRGSTANPDPSQLVQVGDGTRYSHVLPSLNLVAELPANWLLRLGLAKTLARPDIVALRAGGSTPSVVGDLAGPHVGEWTPSYAGNPRLKPWVANSMDIALEKYFNKRSYLALGAFRKNLLSYVFNEQVAQDNSRYPQVAPPGVTPLRDGPLIRPVNGQGGKVEGLELAFALDGGLASPALEGIGLVFSGSKLSSSIRERDNGNSSLNGLSGRSNSFTVYYERDGFSARFSQRYRSPFTATLRDIYLNSTTRQQAADKVADVQLGYAFEEGSLKGLSLLFQVNNLFDKETSNLVSVGPNAPDASALYPNYVYRFGRQSLLGFSYKF